MKWIIFRWHLLEYSCISENKETLWFFFRGLQREQEVLLTHGDSLEGVAEGFTAIAHSGSLIAGRKNYFLYR